MMQLLQNRWKSGNQAFSLPFRASTCKMKS